LAAPIFVSQCSLSGLQPSLPLQWPTPAQTPASPKKSYRSEYRYAWGAALANAQQVLTWTELSEFDLLLLLVDFNGMRPVLAQLLGWESGRGWEPFDPLSFFLLVSWQIANRWRRSQVLKNLADERYADYAHGFGFREGVYPNPNHPDKEIIFRKSCTLESPTNIHPIGHYIHHIVQSKQNNLHGVHTGET